MIEEKNEFDRMFNQMAKDYQEFIDTNLLAEGIKFPCNEKLVSMCIVRTLEIARDVLNLNKPNFIDESMEFKNIMFASKVASTASFVLEIIHERYADKFDLIAKELINDLRKKDIGGGVYVLNYKDEVVIPVPSNWDTILEKRLMKGMLDSIPYIHPQELETIFAK